jgi:hypothetical protein
MCRLYVAVNDEKGNKIHRHGSNNWDNINREFIDCLLNYKNNYGYVIEVRKRKSRKLYKSYTITVNVGSEFITHILNWEISEGKHCKKVRYWDECDDECYWCRFEFKNRRLKQLDEMFCTRSE